METKLYTCAYCFEEFKPTRRRVQKYCSNSCRSKAYHLRTNNNNNKEKKLPIANTTDIAKQQSDKMSLAGTGNALAGSLLAEGIINMFKAEQNKAATKGDLLGILQEIKGRYHPINNLPLNQSGQKPYYDIITQEVVYPKLSLFNDKFRMG